jgi:hypothetical protein
MTGKQMLDMCSSIIKRQDLDRVQLLFFINNIRRNAMLNVVLFPNTTTKNITFDTLGEFSISANKIKAVKSIEYVVAGGARQLLSKLTSYEQARRSFDFSGTGTPVAYLEYGDTVKLLPVPQDGAIEVYAEFHKDDVTDTTATIDPITNDLAEALVYLGSAEYFDMLDELQKGNFWRQKGSAMLTQYISHLKHRQADNLGIMDRDPFGNLGLGTMVRKNYYELDDSDMGVF